MLAAENAYVLNNLAWLYATCPVPEVCRPERALALALEAAKLNDSHYVLDTLAESYYVNGLYEKAIVTIRRALRIETGDKTYLETQLRKFEEAASRGR